MLVKLTMVGGAAHRRPTPLTGDLDVRVCLEQNPYITGDSWKSFGIDLIQKVSSLLIDLWGEKIDLDLGIPTDNGMTIIFKDGMPDKLIPYREFPYEYCIGEWDL